MRLRLVACLVAMAPALAAADDSSPISLTQARAPTAPVPWESPAQIAYQANSGAPSSFLINAALLANLPNVPRTTIQPQVSGWIAKNTLLAKRQDKKGADLALGMALGTPDFGAFPQLKLGVARDGVLQSSESIFEGTVNLSSKPLKLGGCGRAEAHGCNYWDLLVGYYSDNVTSSTNNLALGRVAGWETKVKVTLKPFAEQKRLAPLSFGIVGQIQSDLVGTEGRNREHRTYVDLKASWAFYKEGDTVKPSLSIERVVGSDVLVGLSKQAYNLLSFGLQF